MAEREREREEVVDRSGRVEVRSLEHRPDAARRPLEILVAAEDERTRPLAGRDGAACGVRRLAGAVRAELFTVPRSEERQVVDREQVAEPLRQMLKDTCAVPGWLLNPALPL